jgi:hypothetical protein
MTALLDAFRSALEAEPLRVITYGAVVVVWLATHIGFALGVAAAAPSFDAILALITGIVAAMAEIGRRFVFAPATVATMAATTDPEPMRAGGLDTDDSTPVDPSV